MSPLDERRNIKLNADNLEVPDYHSAVERFFEEGWTDGLPIVPPTPARVAEMIAYCGRDAEESLGPVAPYAGEATIEKLAINAVMAGCRPDYFPVVIAAIEALLEPEVDLHGIQTTTHNSEPLIIVNGPIVKRLGFMYSDGCFGSGSRANGTVGRALQLILWNLGRSYPGDLDKCTLGHPGNWSYCIAEDEDSNPWQPLHVERGMAPGSNAVTVFACEAPHGIMCYGTASQMLRVITGTMRTTGSSNAISGGGESLVILNPLNAEQFAREGWSKADIKRYLWDNVRNRISDLENQGPVIDGAQKELRERRKWISWENKEQRIPIADTPEEILIVVAGGRTWFASWCPGWGPGSRAVTKEVNSPPEWH